MKGSLRLGSVRGIQLFVHWTFLILIAWIAWLHLQRGGDLRAVAGGVVFILAVFGCVVLHELGHALMAQQFGIPTRDITLLPIGGVARLERMPDKPGQELAVAIAGPAVNVAIAGVLFALLALTGTLQPVASVDLIRGGFVERLMLVNVTLVLFNLLPAFPMDGGRVLRALLAYRLEYARATRIAAVVGQAMAAIFGFLGLMGNPFLVFIALFVWIGASQEAQAAELRSVLQGRRVRDAMMTRFRALNADDSLAAAKDELLAGAQQDFPVVAGGRVIGMLSRTELIRGLAGHGLAGRVGESMLRDCPVADEGEPLEGVYLRMRQHGCTTLPVVRGKELTGIVTLENVGELMMVDFAMRGRE